MIEGAVLGTVKTEIYLPYHMAMACSQLHVVLCCIPCYGHAKPLIIYAERLAEAGHEVTYATSKTMVPHCKNICKDPRVNMLALEDGLVPESENFMLGRPDHVKTHPVWFAEQKMTPPLVAAIESMCRRPDLVISDHLTWAGSNAARAHGLKHACHVTWPLYMLEEAGLLPARSLARSAEIHLHAALSCRLVPAFLKPPGPTRAMLEGVRLHCLGGDGECSSGLVLVTSCFGIEPSRPLPPFVRVIGRGHRPETVEGLDEHPELKAFLDKHDDVVYVTFGSRIPPPASLVRSVGEGLLAGGWAVVWSLKEAQQAYLPDAVVTSSKFFVRSWLPQGPALAHPNIRAAITHCGMGGLFECAVNAVPVVPLPFLLSADQPVNARAAESAGFAARPRPSRSAGWGRKFFRVGGDPDYTANAIREAVSRAVNDPMLLEGAKRAKRAVLAAGYGRGAVDAVESVCLYGTDYLTTGAAKRVKTSSSSRTPLSFVIGVAVGAAFAAAMGCVAFSAGSRAGIVDGVHV